MRAPAAVAMAMAVLLGACTEEKKRDPVVAKAELPVKLTVRKHEVRYKPPCEEKGLDVYKCWLMKPEKTGCVYLDVGEPFDDPAHENPCDNNRENRLILAAPPSPIDFEVDAPGYRFAWRTGSSWQVGYLWDGQLIRQRPFQMPNTSMYAALERRSKHPGYPPPPPLGELGLAGSGETKSSTPIDWLALKSFDDALPELYFDAPDALQPGLLARLRKLGGEPAVVKMLSGRFAVGLSGWDLAFETLEAKHQREVSGAVEKALFEDGDEDAIEWFDEHSDLTPKGFEARLAARAKDAMPHGELEVTQRWLTRGYRKHDPEAGALACQLLEAEALNNAWGMGEGGYYDPTAYAVISATHTRCAEVTRALGTSACDTTLRCNHATTAGSAGSAGEGESYDDGPMCTLEDVKKVSAALENDDEMFDDYEPAAKLGALLAQGPLPKTMVLADARRSYVLDRPDAGEDADPLPGLCGADPTEVSRFLCQLRPEQTRFTLMGCKVEIDDAKRVVRMAPLDVPDAGR